MLKLIALCKILLIRNLTYICFKIFPPRVTAFPSVYTKEMVIKCGNQHIERCCTHASGTPAFVIPTLSKGSLAFLMTGRGIVNYAYSNLMLGLRSTAISIPKAPSFNLYNGNDILHGDGMQAEARSYLLLLDNFQLLNNTKSGHWKGRSLHWLLQISSKPLDRK